MTEHQLQKDEKADPGCKKCGYKYSIVENSGLCINCYKEPRKNKYNAKRTEYKGWLYDSKKEADMAYQLDILVKEGAVKYYLQQVPFRLPGHIIYRVDFQVFWRHRGTRYIDIKGMMTQVSKNKIKQVEEIYGIEIEII